MKQDIHPQYHQKAQVECACGNKFAVGSTKEEIEVEICSNCHPFYTGKNQLIDTAGRAEKFEKRRKRAEEAKAKADKKKKSAKKKASSKKKSEESEVVKKARETLNN